MATLKVSGRLTRVEQRRENEIDWNYSHRYSPNSEHLTNYLDCALEMEDGKIVYFKTPAVAERVTCVPGAAVNSFDLPETNPWFRKEGSKAVATPNDPSDVRIVAAVKVGDVITIQGRIKADRVSKAGKPYLVMNHIKLIQE